MLPCQMNCSHYCEGCHKTCAAWRVLQQRQREDQQRRKEYLRRANESFREVLYSYRQAGAYIGTQTGH